MRRKNYLESLPLRDGKGLPLPRLSTCQQIGEALQVTSRTVLNWEASGLIKAAVRQGRIVRFDPSAVARALGLCDVHKSEQGETQPQEA